LVRVGDGDEVQTDGHEMIHLSVARHSKTANFLRAAPNNDLTTARRECDFTHRRHGRDCPASLRCADDGSEIGGFEHLPGAARGYSQESLIPESVYGERRAPRHDAYAAVRLKQRAAIHVSRQKAFGSQKEGIRAAVWGKYQTISSARSDRKQISIFLSYSTRPPSKTQYCNSLRNFRLF